MPTVNYTNVGGQIIAENRGGNRSFYGADPLGSTVVLYDSSGTATDTFSYWPYGEVRASTGSTTTPFKFCGTWGYYGDATGRLYVRARFYRDRLARWLTADPLWPKEMAYQYVTCKPNSGVDPDGLMQDFEIELITGNYPAGIGDGQCPGKAAFESAMETLRSKPFCGAALRSLCKQNSIRTFVKKSVSFHVQEKCADRTGTASSCVMLPGGPNPVKGQPDEKCRPQKICFTNRTCRNGSTDFKACLLILEIANWCTCAVHNRTDEKETSRIIKDCELEKTCWPLTIAR